MAKISAFEKHFNEYEDWFERNKDIYYIELETIRELLSGEGKGLEIGVGTGRFAEPLNIKIGVEPSEKMARIAKQRNIEVYKGVAENLPFEDIQFDFALMVTTICFVDDVLLSLKEARRVLKDNGYLIVGFVDKDSKLGKIYMKKREKSKFYKEATFYSSKEIIDFLKQAGFRDIIAKQTLLSNKGKIDLKTIIDGYGEGSFVVMKAFK